MKKYLLVFWPIYLTVFLIVLILTVSGSRAITTLSENRPVARGITFVIDAGHGGEDGGAISCTGILESQINLDVALRLNDLLHLLGYDTVMIRKTDISVYTEGNTIAQKKLSDLKQRVKIVNESETNFLISIHQNFFPDSRYSGAQIFYNDTPEAKEIAVTMQNTFLNVLNPGSNRQCAMSKGVYLMEHIDQPGLLIECGFLSNPEEEAKLRSEDYQKKLCCIIAVHLAQAAN